MKNAVIVSRYGMGNGSDELGAKLLAKYLSLDIEKDDRAQRYVFYNAGVKVALLDEEVNRLLRELEQLGSAVYLCGTCLVEFGLSDKVTVGKTGCMGDVRAAMAMDRVDVL